MKAVLQRVRSASVAIEGETVGEIENGLLILLGVAQGDGEREVLFLSSKIANLRIFADEQGKLNRSLLDTRGEALVVSNFTLCGDCRKGRRPSYTASAAPETANALYERLIRQLEEDGVRRTASGRFGADMQVTLVNDGPVTLVLDTAALMK